ncbi:ThuA domain-containing protein [Thalassotalea sp. PLHSN55]|uniref:ThuA domain-containing protein n=1 Tax=Thalassotalea sp. PLHSN55 TaxID=3435888 RepID=UPI003F82B5AD
MKKIIALIFISLLLTACSQVPRSSWKASFPNDIPVTTQIKNEINAALPPTTVFPTKSARKILIFSGSAGYRHKSIPVGEYALQQLGVSSGAYTSIVSHDPKYFEAEQLKAFDAVILLNSTGDFFMPTSFKKGSLRDDFSDLEWQSLAANHNRLIDNLINYVKGGGGLIGIHAAADACYNNPEYGKTLGALMLNHPWMSNSNVTITVEDSNHPINKHVFEGIDRIVLQEEIYQFKSPPYSRDEVHVLLDLDPNNSDKPQKFTLREDNDFAVSWVKHVAKGRVFYSSLGHRNDIYWNSLILRHYLAGIQFALGDVHINDAK